MGGKLGGGGFAVVFRGVWKGQMVAMKTLFDPHVDEALKREYMDELITMSKLEHPNVVRFLGATRPPKLCFVMELCPGGSLYSKLHGPGAGRAGLSDAELRHWALGVARGLEYLHSRSPAIVHRDLKSHNVLLDDNQPLPSAKLCDFGLVTNTNTTAGTPAYMAPELMQDRPFNRSVDCYAFGVMLWEMWARRLPFAGRRPADIVRLVTAGERPAMRDISHAPAVVRRMCTECWEADPAKRPAASELVRRLNDWRPAARRGAGGRAAGGGGGGGDALDSLMKR